MNSRSTDYHEAIKNVVEHLKMKRNELLNEISSDEVEKAKVLSEMDKLKDKLTVIDANLKKKSEFRKDYDKAIYQSESHFVELMQKSEDFLSKARREVMALQQATGDRSIDCGKASEPANKPECPKKDPEKKTDPPATIVAFQTPDSGNCINCTTGMSCATIALPVPYRANGL